MLAAPSRTAPCPCGSGRRYKDCHGAFGSTAPAIDTDELMRQAQLAFADGRSSDAEGLRQTA